MEIWKKLMKWWRWYEVDRISWKWAGFWFHVWPCKPRVIGEVYLATGVGGIRFRLSVEWIDESRRLIVDPTFMFYFPAWPAWLTREWWRFWLCRRGFHNWHRCTCHVWRECQRCGLTQHCVSGFTAIFERWEDRNVAEHNVKTA